MLETHSFDTAQLAAARELLVNEQIASVSLLQRTFRVGYGAARSLMDALVREGIVTASNGEAPYALSPVFQEGTAAFRSWALSAYTGCDGGDHLAKTWVLGIEHGDSPSDGPADPMPVEGYSIARQSKYRYNVQVFKLLSAIHGGRVEDWLRFAEREQPFVHGARGYFKGNLYPFPCWTERSWSDEALRETGFASKERYGAWCRNHRFDTVAAWIDAASPDLVIATGIGRKNDFLQVAFDSAPVQVHAHRQQVGEASFTWYSARRAGRLLVVLPHLSGYPLMWRHGTLHAFGERIAALREGEGR
jgi:hypothetical protein